MTDLPAATADDVAALRRRAAGLATLVEVSGALAATLDLGRVLQAATDGVCRLAGLDTAAIYLLEGDHLRLGATTPPLPQDFPEALRRAPLADHPHLGRAIATGSPLLLADARAAALTPAERVAVEQRSLRTILYMPLVAGVTPVGALIVASGAAPRPLPPEEVDLCRALANLAALACENARLFESGQASLAALARQAEETRRAHAERLELERQLLHAQKLESLGLLAGGVAHDFNNLLQATLGNLSLALEALPPGGEGAAAVEQAALAARRASDLTRQLLAYSGKGRFVVQPLDLSALVREHAHLLRASVPRSCALDLRLAAGLPPVEADAGQLQQVVLNLITNAAEALGGREGTVTIATALCPGGPEAVRGSRAGPVEPAAAYVALEVADTGAGMDAEALARLFEPFFSTKGPGRGLGMSALLGIVRGHRGALFVESAPGRGTTVRALLPAQPGAASRAEPPAAHASPHAPGRAPPVAGAVLVVDDEELVRATCQRMVQALGAEVLAAAGGREAVELVRSRPGLVRVVLCDLSMPGMDGLATLEALLAVDPGLRVILSSGYDQQALDGREAGRRAAGFIQKPYTVRQLREVLARAGGPA